MRRTRKRVITVIFFIGMLMLASTCAFAEEDVSEETEAMDVPTSLITCAVETVDDVAFDGTAHRPPVSVHDGEKTLDEGQDYSLSYGENIHAGEGWILITGKANYCDEIKVVFTIKKAELVVKGSHNPASGKPKITWKDVKGAAEYEVYRASNKNGIYRYLAATKKTSYTDKEALHGKSYYYKVKAVDANGETINFETSNTPKITCKLPVPTVKATNVAKSGKPKLSWKKIEGAEKYAVYRATKKNGAYKYMTTTKKTEWIHTKALSGKKYYYWVKAIDTDNRNADSKKNKVISRTCDLKRPAIQIILNSSAKPKLSWKKISGAGKYEVYRSTKKNGTYQSIGETKNLYYVDKTAKGGKSYYYRVCALHVENKNASSAKSLRQKIYVVDLNKKLLALTFDDGPGPYTERIVNTLEKYNAKATFFVLGQRVNDYKAELKAIYRGGNEVGNHSYSHPILSYEGKETIQSQMKKTDNRIKSIIGTAPTLMRPPGGGVDSTVKKNVGKPLIMWNIDTRDWEHRDTQTTINCVMKEADDGDIVLMHDIHAPTMEAAVKLIPKLKKAGFELVTVSDLAKFKGKKLKNGTVYYSF